MIHLTNLVGNLLISNGYWMRCAEAAFYVLSLSFGTKMTSWKHVKLIFSLVHGAVYKEEHNTSDEGDDGNGAIVPDKARVGGKWSESLGKSSGESGGEELH